MNREYFRHARWDDARSFISSLRIDFAPGDYKAAGRRLNVAERGEPKSDIVTLMLSYNEAKSTRNF